MQRLASCMLPYWQTLLRCRFGNTCVTGLAQDRNVAHVVKTGMPEVEGRWYLMLHKICALSAVCNQTAHLRVGGSQNIWFWASDSADLEQALSATQGVNCTLQMQFGQRQAKAIKAHHRGCTNLGRPLHPGTQCFITVQEHMHFSPIRSRRCRRPVTFCSAHSDRHSPLP